MHKVATNARWSGLSPENLEKLEDWLFNDNLTFQAVHELAKRELNFSGSITSLKRFYQRRHKERVATGFYEMLRNAKAIEAAPGDTGTLRAAAMKIMNRQFLKRIMENPDDFKDWEPLARLVLRNEDNEYRRHEKAEENRIRSQQALLEREKWHFEAVRQALHYREELNEALERSGNPDYTEYRSINKTHRLVFGDAMDGIEPLPESEDEEKLFAKRAEARRESVAKANDHWRRTGQHIDSDYFLELDEPVIPTAYPLPEFDHDLEFEI